MDQKISSLEGLGESAKIRLPIMSESKKDEFTQNLEQYGLEKAIKALKEWLAEGNREGNDLILSYIDGVWGQMSNYKDNEEKTKEMFYELLREFPGEDADKKAA